MTSSKVGRVLLIAAINLGILLALMTVTELISRHVERAKYPWTQPQQVAPKRGSELRVFAFGASTVWGEPVPEISFIAQMRYWLRRFYPDRDIRIYNFGARGKNTAYVLRELTSRLDEQPDLILVITGSNEFLTWGPEPEGIARIPELLLSYSATTRLLQRAVGKVTGSRGVDPMPCQVQPWDRESDHFKSRLVTLEKEMRLIVERTSQRRIPLLLATSPSNIADWPPAYQRLPGRNQGYTGTVSRIQELLRNGKYGEAADAVTAGFSLYPEDAMLYFLRGRVQLARGSYADARESFVKARDLDPVPWRAIPETNSIIRRVASATPDVHLVDLDRVYEEHSEHGLVGNDLIFDNCHTTPLGDSLTAKALVQTMVEIGFLPARQPPEECCPVGTFLTDAGYFEPKSPLRLHAFLDTGTYAMKTPFFNYELSREYLLEAMKVDQNSWEVWANLATIDYLTGDSAAGARELRRATELHRRPIDVNDRWVTPYLKEALEYPAGCTSSQQEATH
ncbi:MAG TPA: tetratricopeptide repeat protein [Terriglobia bacterium]|nr:tetratricopeptide repeat protein [Terriglobia bacterium]